MSFLGNLFKSSSGSGMSKKILVTFITGTVLPLLEMIGVNHDIVVMIGQLAVTYIIGQSAVDFATNLKFGGGNKS